MVNKLIKYFFYLLFIPLWWLQLLLPRNKNIWIFGSWFGKKYSDNPKYIFEYVNQNHPDIKSIWLTRDPKIRDRLCLHGFKSVLVNSIAGIFWSLRAGCCIFSSGKRDINLFFINGAKLVNTWHGAPMKKIALDDSLVQNARKNTLIKVLFPFIWEYNLDAILSTADIFNNNLKTAFNLPINKVLSTGYPRNDIFYSIKIHPLISKWNQEFNNPVKIFYLPTFRNLNQRFEPFKSFGFYESKWQHFLKINNAILISKGHYIDDTIGSNSKFNNLIHLSDKEIDDLNEVLKDVDILITDYSGVYFDFLLTGKPIIFAPFDLDTYIKDSRQLYFNYSDITCGPLATNWTEVMFSIKEILEKDTFIEKRKSMNNTFNKFHDSNSSKRAFSEIMRIIYT